MFVLTRSGIAIRSDLVYMFEIEEHEEGFDIIAHGVDDDMPIEYNVGEYCTFDEAYDALSELLDMINSTIGY